MWERESETGRDGMKDGRAGPLWRRRGMEVSRPLRTGAKWCHAIPLSDRLSAWLASTQVIKASCPSCEIKGHITKGQFGSVLNHIYCSSITGSLFSSQLAAERIMTMPTKENNKNFLLLLKTVNHLMPQLVAHNQVPSIVLILNDGFNLCHSPYSS